MIQKIKKLFLSFVFLSNMLFSKPSSMMVEHSLETEKKSAEFDEYFNACLHQAKGNVPKSKHFYKKFFQKKQSKEATKSYIKLLFDTHDFVEVLKQTEKKYTTDPEMQLLRAQAFLMTGNNEAAAPLFAKLSTKKPHDFTVHYQQVICLLRMNKVDEALKVIAHFMKNNDETPQHAMLYFLQSKIFLLQNNKEKALASIETSLRLYPKFDQGILFKSLLLEQMGRPEDAIAGYIHFLEQAAHPQVEQELMNMLLKYNKDAALAKQIGATILLNNPEYFYAMGQQLLIQNRIDPALAAFKKAAILSPKEEKAWKAQLQIIKQKKEADSFLTVLSEWMVQSDFQLEQCALLLSANKVFLPCAKSIRMLEALDQKKKLSEEGLSILADLYLEEKLFSQGLKILERLELSVKDTKIKGSILFQKGYVHFMLEEKVAAEALLKKALEVDSLPEASNLLAILYAQKESMLEEADKLISSALVKQPHNQAFLETKEQILKKRQLSKK